MLINAKVGWNWMKNFNVLFYWFIIWIILASKII